MKFSYPVRALFAFVLAFAAVAEAQIPGVPSLTPGKTAGASTETQETADARLEKWRKEAQTAFSRVNEPDADKKLPEGIDAAALADYRRDLEQIILGIIRQKKLHTSLPDVRKAFEAARTADEAWKGFPEPPPYSMLMVDDLMNQRDAVKAKASSHRSSLQLLERTLESSFDEARNAEDATKRLVAAAAEESNPAGPASWRVDADTARARVLAMRILFIQTNIDVLKEQAETAKFQLALLDKQIPEARKHAALSDEDIEKVKKAAVDRQASIRKEVSAVEKRQRAATTERVKAQAAVDQIIKATPENETVQETPELQLAKIKMEAAETQVNALQNIAETLESLEQVESYVPAFYQDRKNVLEAKTRNDRNETLEKLKASEDRFKAWETVIHNELSAINADIGEQETRASVMAADDPRLPSLNSIRALLWEKQAVVQRLLHSLTAQKKMIRRWLAEFDDPNAKVPFSERVAEVARGASEAASRVWNFEVFEYQETVPGIPTPQKRGVPLGKMLIAITFFLITYFIARGFSNRLRNTVVRRGYIGEAQAKTLSNWLMIVVSVMLLIWTLNSLSIPITIFAFFGGALAIGLGFGTQTLIKNFISGIIVLFERKLRVGDIVDIGGVSGTIIEINTRSSVLRSGDGKETLVPNSLFLENRVTNLTLSNRRVRRLLSVRVAHGASPQTVMGILKECVERHGLVLSEPVPIVTFEDFLDNALAFGIYYWTEFNDKTNGDVVASDLRIMIEKRFKESEIYFPGEHQDFPVSTREPLKLEWVGGNKPAGDE